MLRLCLPSLIGALLLTGAAHAQAPANSPFGAPSKPLTAEELRDIKREAEAHRRARAEAAHKAKEEAGETETIESKPLPEKAPDPYAAPVPEVEASESTVPEPVKEEPAKEEPKASDAAAEQTLPDVGMPEPEPLAPLPDVNHAEPSAKKP